jgi:hypothetical protein
MELLIFSKSKMTNKIMGLIPLSMSLSLVGENLKLSEKAGNAKDIVKQGVKNIFGTSLIKSVAQSINF